MQALSSPLWLLTTAGLIFPFVQEVYSQEDKEFFGTGFGPDWQSCGHQVVGKTLVGSSSPWLTGTSYRAGVGVRVDSSLPNREGYTLPFHFPSFCY